ncbi:translation initiation factor IF-3 [Candidatus Margulisiibacteriota bacterium]
MNDRIRFPEVRVVGADSKPLGVMLIDKAKQLARDEGLDLVLIAPTGKPPVCRIADLGKLKYDAEKKEKEARKSSRGAGVLKELKLSVKIGEHDFKVVARKAVDFLTRKNKVKISLRFRGREVVHPELGLKVIQRLIGEVAEVGEPEAPPKRLGRNYFLMLTPKQ